MRVATANSYDNTIVYTDYFIDQTMKLLERLPESTSSALIYISDHGESLGENNLYLHGTPYLIAPEAQTHVPFFYWTPDQANQNAYAELNCLKNQQNHPLSHDNIFHSMLGFMDISSAYYKSDLDLFSPCKASHFNNLAAEFTGSQ